MKKIIAFVFAGLMAAAVIGCHSTKQQTTTPTGNMGDAGTEPSRPPPPPAS